MRTALRFLLALTLATTGLVVAPTAASAVPEPSFRVVCYPTGIAKNDPIVFPGKTGLSHMHTFYGAKGVDHNTTAATLATATSSQCGSYFDGIDNSAYWIPTLYKDGQPVYSTTGAYQLHAYYQRAGGADGALVDQAWPRGLKIIAGDMHATTPQRGILYFCANSVDTGSQSKASTEFPTCTSEETLVARLQFPDCWDGVYLDSEDHKSHMAYSTGARNTCPTDHPVKIAQLTVEAWFFSVNGDGSDFRWASGGPYSFHGDVVSMWQPRAAANLVNQCINVAFDCNPLVYSNIPNGNVSQDQIEAQYKGVEPGTPSPSPTSTMTMSTSPVPSASPTHEHSMTPSPSATPTTTNTAPRPTPTRTNPTATPSAALGILTSDTPTFKVTGKSFLDLGVDVGDWGPAPVSFRYQWLRDGEPIIGETGSSYSLKRADKGSFISVRVTGSKTGFANLSRDTTSLGPIWFPWYAQPAD